MDREQQVEHRIFMLERRCEVLTTILKEIHDRPLLNAKEKAELEKIDLMLDQLSRDIEAVQTKEEISSAAFDSYMTKLHKDLRDDTLTF